MVQSDSARSPLFIAKAAFARNQPADVSVAHLAKTAKETKAKTSFAAFDFFARNQTADVSVADLAKTATGTKAKTSFAAFDFQDMAFGQSSTKSADYLLAKSSGSIVIRRPHPGPPGGSGGALLIKP